MLKNPGNRCADCGALTQDFLCPRCAEICDKLTSRGEYWQRTIRSEDRLGAQNTSNRKGRSTDTARNLGGVR